MCALSCAYSASRSTRRRVARHPQARPCSDVYNVTIIFFFFSSNYKFDGLDLDWEYPTKRDGKPYDRENFVLLVKVMIDVCLFLQIFLLLALVL